MLFDSVSFLIFFPIVVVLYFLLPKKWRWLFLLAASCYFYMSFIPYYILVLLYLIIIDFVAGIMIERVEGHKKKIFLIISLLANIGTLFFFKYFNFFNANVTKLAALIHWNYPIGYLAIILPLGLSFHTFQSLAYVIEVYKGRYKAERNIGIYALYVMFFPQLVAGPIERPQQLLPQLNNLPEFNENDVVRGLKITVWGFFKKVVVADSLGVIVDSIYNNVHASGGFMLALAAPLFMLQLYADFSGYSDIARGTAKVFGIDLINNFDVPLFSRSVAEYWRRWHISLSTWFRDYLYDPLAFKLRSEAGVYIALFVTFVVMGLWHGATWTFVVFGIIFGIYAVFGLYTRQFRMRLAEKVGLTKVQWLYASIQIFFTFCCVTFANIFFRVTSLHDAIYVVSHMWSGWLVAVRPSFWRDFFYQQVSNGLKDSQIISLPLSCLIMLLGEYWQRERKILDWLQAKPAWARYLVYYAILIWILSFGYFKPVTFIYFQF